MVATSTERSGVVRLTVRDLSYDDYEKMRGQLRPITSQTPPGVLRGYLEALERDEVNIISLAGKTKAQVRERVIRALRRFIEQAEAKKC